MLGAFLSGVRRADVPDHGGRRGVPLLASLHGAGDVLGPGSYSEDLVLSWYKTRVSQMLQN